MCVSVSVCVRASVCVPACVCVCDRRGVTAVQIGG